jgi:hypothetical protein
MASFLYPPVAVNSSGLATEAKQDAIITELQTANTTLTSLDGKDFATQTTLNALNTKVATETTLASIDTKVATETTLALVLADTTTLIAKDFATETTLAAILADTASLDAKDFATETTLAALNAKVTAVDTTGKATEAKQDTIISRLELDIVDQIDATPLLDTSVTNIPGSASAPVQIVASTAARVRKVISVEDIGEFIGLYTGAPASEVLECVLPLGGGAVEVDIPASTRLSLRAMGVTAVTTGNIAINMLG